MKAETRVFHRRALKFAAVYFGVVIAILFFAIVGPVTSRSSLFVVSQYVFLPTLPVFRIIGQNWHPSAMIWAPPLIAATSALLYGYAFALLRSLASNRKAS